MKLHVRLVHVCAALLLCGVLLPATALAQAPEKSWSAAMLAARQACLAGTTTPAEAWKAIDRPAGPQAPPQHRKVPLLPRHHPKQTL